MQALLISRSSAKAPFAAAGKPGRVWPGSHPHPAKPHTVNEPCIFRCPRQVPAQPFTWRDGSARQHGLMRFDHGIETPWSPMSFFLPVYLAEAEPGGQGRTRAIGKKGQLQTTSTSEKTVGDTVSPGL